MCLIKHRAKKEDEFTNLLTVVLILYVNLGLNYLSVPFQTIAFIAPEPGPRPIV